MGEYSFLLSLSVIFVTEAMLAARGWSRFPKGDWDLDEEERLGWIRSNGFRAIVSRFPASALPKKRKKPAPSKSMMRAFFDR